MMKFKELRYFFYAGFWLCINLSLFAQQYEAKDVEICNSKFELALSNEWTQLTINELIAEIGKNFIGTEYESHSLEITENEELVVNLRGLDCTTFLENVLVIARLIIKNKTSFEDYLEELKLIRYRGGELDEYPSRLHYFSDWIHDNVNKGVVRDITMELGGEVIQFDLHFMSSNPQYYKHLKNNPEFIEQIKRQEIEISDREYYFIPKLKIPSIEKQIHDGDVIAFTSNVKGLDINHVGIAVRKNGKVHLLHAPGAGKKVQITEEPVSNYIKKIKKHTGIIVVRASNP